MYSFGLDTQGKIFIAPPNAERIDLMSMYSHDHKLLWLTASSFITGDKQWKLIVEFSLMSQKNELHTRQGRGRPFGFTREGEATF